MFFLLHYNYYLGLPNTEQVIPATFPLDDDNSIISHTNFDKASRIGADRRDEAMRMLKQLTFT